MPEGGAGAQCQQFRFGGAATDCYAHRDAIAHRHSYALTLGYARPDRFGYAHGHSDSQALFYSRADRHAPGPRLRRLSRFVM